MSVRKQISYRASLSIQYVSSVHSMSWCIDSVALYGSTTVSETCRENGMRYYNLSKLLGEDMAKLTICAFKIKSRSWDLSHGVPCALRSQRTNINNRQPVTQLTLGEGTTEKLNMILSGYSSLILETRRVPIPDPVPPPISETLHM